MENINPVGMRIIIEPIPLPTKTISGIDLGNNTDKFIKGYIFAISENIPSPYFIVNQKVSYNKLKIDDIKINGKNYHLIHHDDIIGIIEENI